MLFIETNHLYEFYGYFFFFLESICNLPHTSGGSRCYALMYRYHYNHEANKCEEVVYGGCGATANNFETIEECEKACGDHNHRH